MGCFNLFGRCNNNRRQSSQNCKSSEHTHSGCSNPNCGSCSNSNSCNCNK